MPEEIRTQHYIDSDGKRKPIQVKIISQQFKLGKGGALQGAEHDPAPAEKKIGGK